ncbi:hypothetical protein D3C79_648450 [compost metagenome]
MLIEFKVNGRTAQPGDLLQFPTRRDEHNLYMIVHYTADDNYGLINMTGTSSQRKTSRYNTIEDLLEFHKTGEVLSASKYKISIEQL